MVWAKRFFFFMLVNVLMMLTISFILNFFNVQPYLTASGMDYESLAAFCLIYGMVGSFVSLLLSKFMAKRMYGVKIIDANAKESTQRNLYLMVDRLAKSANLPRTPEVGIYPSGEVNAFATGATKGSAMVAVSMGLLNRMEQGEIEGVLGHEIAHIANGDMVTMTLLQGIMNAFVMFFARAIAFAVSQGGRSSDDRDSRGGGFHSNYMLVFVLEMVLGLAAAVVVAGFSRWREFRADRGGATFAGRQKMIAALERLRATHELVDGSHPATAAFKIAGARSFLQFFSTHPPLEARIARLKQMAY